MKIENSRFKIKVFWSSFWKDDKMLIIFILLFLVFGFYIGVKWGLIL